MANKNSIWELVQVICRNCNTGFADGESYCPKCGAERDPGYLKQKDELGCGLPPGTALHGDYCISGFFKKGAVPIYTAKSLKSGNPVLIEEYMPDHATSDNSKYMKPPSSRNGGYANTAVSHLSLKEKADLLGNLAHPGFPTLYDHFIQDNNEYLVMAPPRGKNLSQLAAQGAIERRISLIAVIKLCIFIEGVHHLQYVHLDMVPENVYITDEFVYLFPFTRVQRAGSHGNGYLTTDGFSAPELFLAESRPIDIRSDIYSVGALIYWLFSGKKLPFGGVDRSTLISDVKSPSLARIIQSCTSQAPESRPDKVGQIKNLLLQHLREDMMEIRVDTAGLTDKGMERTGNEDSLCVVELERCYGDNKTSCGIYVIADGMGGHEAGEVASKIAVEVISRELISGLMAAKQDTDFATLIRDAVNGANKAILETSRKDRALSSMGCTVTAALRVGESLFLGHVGDSRGYLIRDGSIRQLTRDHSVVAGLLERGLITAEQAKTDPERGRILRSLGNEDVVEIDQYEDLRTEGLLDLKPGDVLLLCSDGLPDVVTDDEILACINSGTNGAGICAELICLANSHGGYDNISIIVVKATGDRL